MKRKKVPKSNRAKSQNSGKQNPVAKHARSFTKAQVHTDRKKAAKRGYVRCKPDFLFTQSDSKAA